MAGLEISGRGSPPAQRSPTLERVHHRRPGRRARLLAVGIGGVAATAIAAAVATVLPSEANVSPAAAQREEGDVIVNVEDVLVPGPALNRTVGTPNRVGSERIPVRVYTPESAEAPWATLVWAHGGSFVHGNLDWPESDWVARRFAERGLRVYAVDYVLANDEVKAPAPEADVAAVLSWAGEQQNGPIIVGGASAGAYLATGAALGQGTPDAGSAADALILEYPTLHRAQHPRPDIAAATSELPEVRRFGPERVAEMYDFYLGDADSTGERPEATIGELPSETLAALPPTMIVNADADDLRASGEQLAAQLREAGVPVTERVETGTVHGYLNRPHESAEATRQATATIDALTGWLAEELRP